MIELSDRGDEDDLSDEEDHPLVALLESYCSLKNEADVGASDSSMVGFDTRCMKGVWGISTVILLTLSTVLWESQGFYPLFVIALVS